MRGCPCLQQHVCHCHQRRKHRPSQRGRGCKLTGERKITVLWIRRHLRDYYPKQIHDGGKWKINEVEKFLLMPSSPQRRSQGNGEDLRAWTVSAHLIIAPHCADVCRSKHAPFTLSRAGQQPPERCLLSLNKSDEIPSLPLNTVHFTSVTASQEADPETWRPECYHDPSESLTLRRKSGCAAALFHHSGGTKKPGIQELSILVTAGPPRPGLSRQELSAQPGWGTSPERVSVLRF